MTEQKNASKFLAIIWEDGQPIHVALCEEAKDVRKLAHKYLEENDIERMEAVSYTLSYAANPSDHRFYAEHWVSISPSAD